MNESEGQSTSPKTQAPRGAGPVWMKRIANVGFGIAALYFVYLVSLLFMASQRNKAFEGQPLGSSVVATVTSPGGVGDPSFSSTLSGGIDLEKMSREKRLIVVLWATWCGPCHSLLMDLKDDVAAGRIGKDDIVAVSMAEPETDVQTYLQKTPLPFQVAIDPSGDLARRLKVSGTPTVVFLNAGSVIAKISTGGFGLPGKIADFLK